MQKAWKILSEITLTHIILFNRLRQGEASKMKLADFNRIHYAQQEKIIMASLSPIEQELCRTLARIEIIEKRGNIVPIY